MQIGLVGDEIFFRSDPQKRAGRLVKDASVFTESDKTRQDKPD